MPELRNCIRCGRLFNYIGGVPLCIACKEDDEEEFKRIKKYLQENPGATISQVASELDVSIEKIKKYLREGRLEIVGDEGIPILTCEKCGKPIKTGRFCNECSRNLASELSSVVKKSDFGSNYQRDGGMGFRYLSRGISGNKRNE